MTHQLPSFWAERQWMGTWSLMEYPGRTARLHLATFIKAQPDRCDAYFTVALMAFSHFCAAEFVATTAKR